MKKLLVVLALLTVSTVGYAIEVVPVPNYDGYIYIVDGKKVFYCYSEFTDEGCRLVSSDYAKPKK